MLGLRFFMAFIRITSTLESFSQSVLVIKFGFSKFFTRLNWSKILFIVFNFLPPNIPPKSPPIRHNKHAIRRMYRNNV